MLEKPEMLVRCTDLIEKGYDPDLSLGDRTKSENTWHMGHDFKSL